jgi:flavin reductase (DIM6/NTAB) family NADH-FMN oxidoreductase RutF/rubredoxin
MNLQAFFKITYGLYVISSKSGNKLNAYIANTAFQVTSEPPQIAISCSKDNYTCQLISESKAFSISILKKTAKPETIGLFGYQSGKDVDKFESIEHEYSATGAPIVTEDCIAWFDCRVTKTLDVGSHILFIANIENNGLIDKKAEPLTYAFYHEVKKGKAPKNAPTYIDESKFTETTDNTNIQHKCLACGHVYDPEAGDPENGIPPNTDFSDLPDDWTCPTCGAGKDMFDTV